MKHILTYLFLLAFGFASVTAQTVPSGMTYQSRLTDASNAPVPDGTGYEIEVRLWSAPTGGTLLWGARYTGVPLKSGAFNLILGSGGSPIPGATTTVLAAAFNTPTVHLGLTPTKSATGATIPTPTEILPRQQIFSTPYAFRAEQAAMVQTDGVTTNAIKDGEVKSSDIGVGEIKSTNVANAAIDSQKIASNSILSSHIAMPGLAAESLDFEFASFVDEKPTNTNGGAYVAGWIKRTLNKTVASKGNSISRVENRITLKRGIYWIHAQVSGFHCTHFSLIRDTTGRDLVRGTHEVNAYYNNTPSVLQGSLMVDTANIELELWSHFSSPGTGANMGNPLNLAGYPENYTTISIIKIK